MVHGPYAVTCLSYAGIGVGHIYYFLKELYPRQSGRQILVTPGFLRQWLADWGLRGAAPPPREVAGALTCFSGQQLCMMCHARNSSQPRIA